MIHQLPLAILEKHLIPILIEDTLPNLRGSCELLCDLSSRRFARFQSKMMTQKTNAHAELTDQLLNDWQQQARDKRNTEGQFFNIEVLFSPLEKPRPVDMNM